MPATVAVGTAGHIDHGKTTLLRVLTGIDADRLPDEQRRGMTIDVGYAHLDLDDGTAIDFVDVPGHDALIGNMLVGAGEIDAAMLVVAADDGPRAQTLEHLALLDALGIAEGIAVVTKADVAGAARAAEVTDAVTALLRGTSLEGSPVLVAAATTAEGIAAVAAALANLRDRVVARWATAAASPPAPLRLAIDRAFAVKGRGAVVTGTLRGGSLRRDAALHLEPGGIPVRVRGLQVHHAAVEAAEGGRTAVNLVGVELEALPRGAILTSGPGIEVTDRLLVELLPPMAGRRPAAGPRAGWPPRDGERLRLHAGTAQVDALVGRRGRESVELPAGQVTALLRLSAPIATFPGDRAVLRRPSPGEVMAGVRVLEPHPASGLSRRRATPARIGALVAAVAGPGPGTLEDARLALRGAMPAAASGRLDLAPDIREALAAEAAALVADHHRARPLEAGLPVATLRTGLRRALRRQVQVRRDDAAAADAAIDGLLDVLVAAGRLARDGDRFRDPAQAAGPSPELAAAMDRVELALDVAAPPGLAEAAAAAGCPPDGIRLLEASGRIVRIEADLAWAAPAFHRMTATALGLARRGTLTPAALRDATGTSRRVVMPLLEDLNRRGLLARTPTGHVPGPRAPRPEVPAP
ncbi:MAG: selenocysteine-specific translation elongation factor [Chloroflexi bacterium]|nr:selenocysteine-specific translation elongation factor [Chloroflexota bacterium]